MMKGGEKYMKKILKWIGIIFVVLIIIGAISSKSKNEPVKTNVNSVSSPQAQVQTTEYKVGDLVKLGDREFSVNSTKRAKSIGYSTPKSGKEYMVVNVTIRNLGSDEVSYNPFDFKMQDANGAQESMTFATLDDSLSSGTLAPNGKVTGSLPFEVPIGGEAKLLFQPSFWNKDRIVIAL